MGALSIRNVRKSFGATAALRGVSLGVGEGEVHALIGENGAGKSTLMKILSGAHEADAGRIALDGGPFAPCNPHEARRAGVAMIYQELNLAPDLSVAENIVLGAEPSRATRSPMATMLGSKAVLHQSLPGTGNYSRALHCQC